jgi:hypothetical protein
MAGRLYPALTGWANTCRTYGAAVWTKRDLENVLEIRAAELFEDGASVRDVEQDLGISTAVAARIRGRRRREPGGEG